MPKRKKHPLSYFTSSFTLVVGLVLVWRGIWHVLDVIDLNFFGGDHLFTGLGGIIIGLLVLYLPDQDLKELRKL